MKRFQLSLLTVGLLLTACGHSGGFQRDSGDAAQPKGQPFAEGPATTSVAPPEPPAKTTPTLVTAPAPEPTPTPVVVSPTPTPVVVTPTATPKPASAEVVQKTPEPAVTPSPGPNPERVYRLEREVNVCNRPPEVLVHPDQFAVCRSEKLAPVIVNLHTSATKGEFQVVDPVRFNTTLKVPVSKLYPGVNKWMTADRVITTHDGLRAITPPMIRSDGGSCGVPDPRSGFRVFLLP